MGAVDSLPSPLPPLHRAVESGSLEHLQNLTQTKSCTQHCTFDLNLDQTAGTVKDTALTLACRLGHGDKARVLIEASASVHVRDAYGSSPLILAVQNKNIEIVAQLLSAKASINACNYSGATPVAVACGIGAPKMVRYLVANEANVDSKTRDGTTPLFYACRLGSLDICEYLVRDAKAKVNARRYDGATCLQFACKGGHLSIVRFLVEEAKSNLHALTRKGASCLLTACLNAHFRVVKYLLEKRAHVNMSNNSGYGPLHGACQVGNLACVMLLVNHKADLQLNHSYRNRGFAVSELSYESLDMSTPLSIARANGRSEVVMYLEKAMKAVRDREGKSGRPWHQAASNGGSLESKPRSRASSWASCQDFW
ncbi:hypothetical protein AAMO2058_001202400 [Amorphochlora amoebiformis]